MRGSEGANIFSPSYAPHGGRDEFIDYLKIRVTITSDEAQQQHKDSIILAAMTIGKFFRRLRMLAWKA